MPLPFAVTLGRSLIKDAFKSQKKEQRKDAAQKAKPKVSGPKITEKFLGTKPKEEKADTPTTKYKPPTSSTKMGETGIESVDKSLTTIQESIISLRKSLKSSSDFTIRQKKIKRIEEDIEDQKKEEEETENKAKKMAESIKKKVGEKLAPGIDAVKNFFVQILIGSFLLWLKKNAEEITKQVREFAEKVEDVFNQINDNVIQPLWNLSKAIIGPILTEITKIVLPNFDQENKEITDKLSALVKAVPFVGQEIQKIEDAIRGLKIQIPEDKLKQGQQQASGSVPPSQVPPASAPQRQQQTTGGSPPPPAGTPPAQGQTSRPTGGSSGLSPNAQALLDTIAYAEGTAGPNGYNTWFGGRTDMDVSSMTINDVVKEQKRRLANGEASYGGYTSAAVGRYQMMEPEVFAVKAGLDPSKDLFSPANQDKMAIAGYMKGQAGLSDSEINGPITRQLIAKIAPVWASLPMLNGASKYGQPVKRYETLVKIYEEKLREAQSSRPTPPAQVAPAVRPQSPMMGEAYSTGLKTGASQHIGGSSAYHIDTKFPADLPVEKAVAMVDQMSRAYAKQGREIEFSNAAVSGLVYDHNAPYAEKLALLKRVFGAHAPRGGWRSMDYYIPLKSDAKGRFGKSAEAAEIVTPTVSGGKIEYHEGGRYGAFVVVVDENGNVVSKTGHGDIRGSRAGTVIDIPRGTNNQSQGLNRSATYDRRGGGTVVVPVGGGANQMMSGSSGGSSSNPPTQGRVNNSWWTRLTNMRLFKGG